MGHRTHACMHIPSSSKRVSARRLAIHPPSQSAMCTRYIWDDAHQEANIGMRLFDACALTNSSLCALGYNATTSLRALGYNATMQSIQSNHTNILPWGSHQGSPGTEPERALPIEIRFGSGGVSVRVGRHRQMGRISRESIEGMFLSCQDAMSLFRDQGLTEWRYQPLCAR